MSAQQENVTEWSPGLEEVLRKEGEESQSLFWLHNQSSIVAARNNDFLQIPSIILQSITGFLSATSGMVPPMVLGAMSILTAIMSTILSYYKFSAKAEAHRMSAQLYLKIYKKLEVELSLPYTQRTDPLKLLEEVREKLARVSEVAPDVPETVILKYKKNFAKGETKAPIIANGLDKIIIYREEEEAPSITPKIRIKIPNTPAFPPP
jgi:hypothetical protein